MKPVSTPIILRIAVTRAGGFSNPSSPSLSASRWTM